jgi:hypothetical protein
MNTPRILLHIGPHKTGTTSVQNWLYEAVPELAAAGIHYPQPEANGPGHAEIAWDMCGFEGRTRDTGRWRAAIAEAQALGCGRVLISAEDFVHGLYNGSLDDFPHKASVEVLLTLSPLDERLLASVAERIKHGESFKLPYPDLPAVRQQQPGLRLGFLAQVLAVFAVQPVTVLLVDKRQPQQALEKFNRVLGTALPIGRAAPLNARDDAAYLEVMNFLNARLDLPFMDIRSISRQIADDLPAGWFTGPQLTPGQRTRLQLAWRRQLAFLEQARDRGRISLL